MKSTAYAGTDKFMDTPVVIRVVFFKKTLVCHDERRARANGMRASRMRRGCSDRVPEEGGHPDFPRGKFLTIGALYGLAAGKLSPGKVYHVRAWPAASSAARTSRKAETSSS